MSGYPYSKHRDIENEVILCEGYDPINGECASNLTRFVAIPTRIDYDDGSSMLGDAEFMLCALHEPRSMAHADR